MDDVDLKFQLKTELSDSQTEQFWMEFIEQAIEAQGLVVGGGGVHHIEVTLGPGANQQITPEHLAAIREWMSNRFEIIDFEIIDFEVGA